MQWHPLDIMMVDNLVWRQYNAYWFIEKAAGPGYCIILASCFKPELLNYGLVKDWLTSHGPSQKDIVLVLCHRTQDKPKDCGQVSHLQNRSDEKQVECESSI